MSDCKQSELIVRELGYLPLAIEQAGAYIWAQGSSLSKYLEEYKTNFRTVMENRPEGLQGYATVYTTWKISLEAIKAKNLAAAQLFVQYSFLSNNVSDCLMLHGGENDQSSNIGLMSQGELDAQISFLLSYSLVKRDVSRRKVWIHPVVHEWTRQHLVDSEKKQMTAHVSDMIARFITWSIADKSPESRLVFARNILPDIEACVNHITQYLLDNAGGNSNSWKSFKILREFLTRQGLYSKGVILAQLLKNEHEMNLGKEHSDTITSMNNLASLFQYQGKYAEAEPVYKEALSVCQKMLGEEHPDTLTSMNNLALLFQYQGRYTEAGPLYMEALSRCKKAFGEEHHDTLISMNNLALFFQYQGKYAEAEPLYQEALLGCKKVLGDEHLDTLAAMNGLALLSQYQGKYTKAEPLYKEALSGYKKALGEEHPDTLTSMNNLASLLQYQGKYAAPPAG